MLRGFIRTASTGQTRKQQQDALCKAGIAEFDDLGPVYVNDRDAAIASLIEGDILVVSEPSRLGVSAVDVLSALEQIGDRGAKVMRADTGETLDWTRKAQKVISFAVEAESVNRKQIAANARKARAASGHLGGIPAVEWSREKVRELKTMLESGEYTRQQMAERLGISRATLQRKIADMRSKKGADQ